MQGPNMQWPRQFSEVFGMDYAFGLGSSCIIPNGPKEPILAKLISTE